MCQDELGFTNKTNPHNIFPLNPKHSNYKRAVSATAANSILGTNNENISKWLAQKPVENLHSSRLKHHPDPGYHKHGTAPTRTVSDSDDTASISSIDTSRISSMNLQGRILKSNMKGLKKLLNPNPLNGVSKCTLTDIYKN